MAGKMVQRGPARLKPLAETFGLEQAPRLLAARLNTEVLHDFAHTCDFCRCLRTEGTLQICERGKEDYASYICLKCMEPLIEAFNILIAEEKL